MGTILHHAIIVTSHNLEQLERARVEAASIMEIHIHGIHGVPRGLVTSIAPYVVNGGGSFTIMPDGSKEDWGTSYEADDARDEIVTMLEGFAYDDGSSSVQWAEVAFAGDDSTKNAVTRSYDTTKIGD